MTLKELAEKERVRRLVLNMLYNYSPGYAYQDLPPCARGATMIAQGMIDEGLIASTKRFGDLFSHG